MRGLDLAIAFLFLVSGSAVSFGMGGFDGEGSVAGELEPVEGHARLTNATYAGDARLNATDGVFGIEGDLDLDWFVEEATVSYHSFNRTGGYAGYGYNLTVTVKEESPPIVERYKDSSLRISGRPSGEVHLWSDPSLGDAAFRMYLDSQHDVPIAGSAFGVNVRSEDEEYHFWLPGPIFGFGHEGSQYKASTAVPVGIDRFEAEGAVNILVQNGRVEVGTDGETDTYDTGIEGGTVKGVVPGQKVSYALIQIPVANLSVEDFKGKWSTFFAPQVEMNVGGEVSFTGSDGEMQGDHGHKPLDEDDVLMQGNVTLELAVAGTSDGTEHSNGSWGVYPELLPEPGVFATFEGEGEGVLVNGRPLKPSATTSASGGSPLQDDLTYWGRLIGVIVLIWAIGWRVLVPALVVLYNGDPLKNPRRRKILAFLRQAGVAHVREVHRATGIAVGSVDYHLKILQRTGHVTSARWGNYRAFFISQADLTRQDMDRLVLLAEHTRREIAMHVAREGPVTQEDLVRSLSKTQGAISRQLCKLVEAGLVRKVKNERQRYSPSELLEEWFRKDPFVGHG